jgi:hypothetical protein
MVDCEKFTDILAAGEDASPREAEEAREHAAVCDECRHVGEAFAAFEGSQPEVEQAPAAFASRVMARLPLEPERRPLVLPARVNLLSTWVLSGAAAVVAAVLGGLVAYFAYTDPEGFAAAANAFTTMPAVDVTTFGSIVGATAAAAVVAGFLAYYYLVPTD